MCGGRNDVIVIRAVLHVQVTVPSLQSRFDHSATAFSLSPGLTEVTIFGGIPNWPSNYKSSADLPQIANTTVLRFGESHLMCVSHTSKVSSRGGGKLPPPPQSVPPKLPLIFECY